MPSSVCPTFHLPPLSPPAPAPRAGAICSFLPCTNSRPTLPPYPVPRAIEGRSCSAAQTGKPSRVGPSSGVLHPHAPNPFIIYQGFTRTLRRLSRIPLFRTPRHQAPIRVSWLRLMIDSASLTFGMIHSSPDMASETSDGTFSMPSTASTVTSTTGSSSNTSQFTGYSSSPVLPPHQQQQNAGYASGRPHARSSAAETLVDFNNHSNGRDLSAPPANDIYKQGPVPYPQQARSHPVETAPSAVRQFNPTQRPEDSPFGFSPFAEPAPSNDFLAQLDSEFRTEPHLLPSVLPSPGNSSYHNPLTSPVDYSQPPYNESSTPHVISPAVHYRPGSTPADGGPLPRPLPPPIATLDRTDPQANGGPHSSHPTGHIQSVYDTRPLAAESRGPELQDQPKEEPRKTGRKLPKPTTDLLRKWLLDHADHPYPNEAEKKMLCAKTDLTIVQLGNWMINVSQTLLHPLP